MLKPFHQFSHQAGNPWNGVQWLHKGFQLNMYIYSLYLSTHLPTYLPIYLSIYLSIAVTLGAETWCSSLSSWSLAGTISHHPTVTTEGSENSTAESSDSWGAADCVLPDDVLQYAASLCKYAGQTISNTDENCSDGAMEGERERERLCYDLLCHRSTPARTTKHPSQRHISDSYCAYVLFNFLESFGVATWSKSMLKLVL